MQSIWILISETYVAPRQLVGIFPTQAAAEEYRDTAVEPVTDGFIEEWCLEGVSAETYLHQALKAVYQFPSSREASLVITKIQEAKMWLDCTGKEEIAQVSGEAN